MCMLTCRQCSCGSRGSLQAGWALQPKPTCRARLQLRPCFSKEIASAHDYALCTVVRQTFKGPSMLTWSHQIDLRCILLSNDRCIWSVWHDGQFGTACCTHVRFANQITTRDMCQCHTSGSKLQKLRDHTQQPRLSETADSAAPHASLQKKGRTCMIELPRTLWGQECKVDQAND